MAKEQIPVTPAVITWARERAGYSVDELTAKFKNLAEWEAGTAFPTYPQLEQLSDKLKVPVAVFFFPGPPDTVPIRESFRTLPEEQFSAIPRRVHFLLRKAKAMQLNLAELNNGRNPAGRLITRDVAFGLDAAIGQMAEVIRNYLGVTVDEQIKWGNPVIALENWRRILIDVGIFVFKDSFKVDNYSGFCLFDDEFPIIYVNNSTAKTRQTFTLFHELAHLIFHTSGIDTFGDEYIAALPANAQRIEVICNRFAGSFLVPEEAFEAAFRGKLANVASAEELADYFNVSREVIYRKFLDRGLIQNAEYERAAEEWRAQKKGGSGGDYYNTQFAYLGPNYIGLAFRQYYQNRISDVQLADYLNIAPKNLNAFEERFLERGA